MCEQINKIIEIKYFNEELDNIEVDKETYETLQKNWHQEIQAILDELKSKEQVRMSCFFFFLFVQKFHLCICTLPLIFVIFKGNSRS